MSEFANDIGALPFQGSDSVNVYDPQLPRVQEYHEIPYNEGHMIVHPPPIDQNRQLSQSDVSQNQHQAQVQQPQQTNRSMSQASCLPFQEYPSGITLQQLLAQQQQQQQGDLQGFQHHPQHQPLTQSQPQSQFQRDRPPQPPSEKLNFQQWIQQQQQQFSSQQQAEGDSRQEPQHQQQPPTAPLYRPQSQPELRDHVDTKVPLQQHGPNSSNLPAFITPPLAKPIIHDQLGVMIPHFEPSTGLESFCTLDQYVQQHIKAATVDHSREVLALQSTIDRLRAERNKAMKDGHTLHGQYTELLRTHNDSATRIRSLETTIKTNNHPEELFAKFQAEVHAKEESIKRLEKRVAKAEEAAKVARDLRRSAEDAEAQKARDTEALQTNNNRLSTKISELENECAQQKTLKYDLAVARSHLKTANTEVTRLREAHSGIVARSDELRRRNEALMERIAEMDAEALLPMPSALPGLSVTTGNATPLLDLSHQITILQSALEQSGADLKHTRAENAQLKSKNADLEIEAKRSQLEWLVRRTQIQDSRNAQALADTQAGESRTRNEQLLDQIKGLKDLISKYEAQIVLPLPDQLATPPAGEHQHSAIFRDLQLEVASYRSRLQLSRAELKQALADLDEARFPWYGIGLEVEGQGQEGQGKREAVDIVKAKINALESTITTLRSANGDLQLQIDRFASEAELKRLKDLALTNARETTKLQILHSGGARLINVTASSPPSHTLNPGSPEGRDDKMEVEIQECSCGREEVILELNSRSEMVFEQTLNLVDNVKTAAQHKIGRGSAEG